MFPGTSTARSSDSKSTNDPGTLDAVASLKHSGPVVVFRCAGKWLQVALSFHTISLQVLLIAFPLASIFRLKPFQAGPFHVLFYVQLFVPAFTFRVKTLSIFLRSTMQRAHCMFPLHMLCLIDFGGFIDFISALLLLVLLLLLLLHVKRKGKRHKSSGRVSCALHLYSVFS